MKKPVSTTCVSGVWRYCQRFCKAKLFGLALLWFWVLLNSTSVFGNCVISCRNINISLDPNGQAILSPSFVLADPSCDPSEFFLEVYNASNQQISDTLDCASVGEVLQVKVIHQATGNRCWSEVTVQDYLAPSIACFDTLLYCTQSADPAIIGSPIVTDNCTPFSQINLSFSDQYEDLPCYATWQNDSVTVHIQRTWTAIDAQGNSATCIQHIYLKRATVDDVIFPENRDGFSAPKLNCLDDPMDLALTGVPTIAGEPIDINGACELVVSFADQHIPQCGNRGEKILRTWTVIDWCSGDFNLDVQLISVADTTPPVLTCPANITVSTDYYECTATVILPNATATDDCSAINIQPSWSFGSGYGPFSNIPTGIHNVLYTATDACGNQASCTMQVTVLDQLTPVAVCDANTVVALGNNGFAYVNVLSFDDGSYDNCDLNFIEIKRENGIFGPQVYFDCADIGQQIPVTLRVHDQAGNYNECTVLAEVKDLWRPAITCPDSVFLDCNDDYRDTNLTGIPLITENCLLDTFYFTDQLYLNSCGLGEVRREWRAIDKAGNQSWCEQVILIRDTTGFEINFPEDFASNQCSPTISPDSSGRPEIIDADCEQIGVTYSDQVFQISGAACYKVFRTWEVIDWCTYVVNNGSEIGRWTHVQLITVHDDNAPVLTCPADTIVEFWGADCSQGAFINLEEVIVDDCDTVVVVSNDSPFAIQSGKNASGFYPPGVHQITFWATDGCGNTSTCSFQLTVVDAKPPEPVCESSISVGLNQYGYVLVDPSLFTIYVADNCTAPEQIQIQLSRDSFTCDDLGEQMVEVLYTDEAGNQAICSVSINITDGLGVCPGSSIAGVIRTEKGSALAGAHVYLEGSYAEVSTTNTEGAFQFEQLPVGGNFTVIPEKDTLYRNGISTFDLILISKHIVGLSRFPSPYQVIAADVNNSGSVSTFDVIELRKMILYINEQFPNSPSWRFVPDTYTFPNPGNPFQTTFPESLSYNQLETDITNANFVAIKVGDVNGSARTDFWQNDENGQVRSGEKLLLRVNHTPSDVPGTSWMELHFTAAQMLAGLQLSLDIPRNSLQKLESGGLSNLSVDNFFHDEQAQELRLSWHTSSPISVQPGQLFFRILLKEGISCPLKHNSRLQSEAYLSGNGFLETIPIEMESRVVETVSPDVTDILTCYPNPLRSQMTVKFQVSEPQFCSLKIVDIRGSVVYEHAAHYHVGVHHVRVARKDLKEGTTGTYFCLLKKESGALLQRQIRVLK